MSTIDELFSELDPNGELKEAFAEGRKWGRKIFYNGETSMRALRLDAGLSQKQLASLSGINESQVAKLESVI